MIENERTKWIQKVKRREKRLQDNLLDIAVKKRVLKNRIEETDNAMQSAINAFQAAEVIIVVIIILILLYHYNHYHYHYHHHHYYHQIDRQKSLKCLLKEFCNIERLV